MLYGFNESVGALMVFRLRRMLLPAMLLALSSCDGRVDFDAAVNSPAFRNDSGPIVLFDAAHHNRHDIDTTYEPFARLITNDGFKVRKSEVPFTLEALGSAKILVIVAAQSQTDTNDAPAFTSQEVEAVATWVRQGGSLLLVTDHYPYPNAAEILTKRLGFDVGKGMTFDTQHHRVEADDDSRLIFSRGNGLLADHPITRGRNPAERVNLVETFTGDAFKARDASANLLRLAPTAQIRLGVPEVTKEGGRTSVTVNFVPGPSGTGWSQGLAFQFGKGRVVALSEAAMLTAQEDGGRRLGMNAPGNDNRQFTLNVVRWLARAL